MSGDVPAAAKTSIFCRSEPGGALCQSTVTFGFFVMNSSAAPFGTSFVGVWRLKTVMVTFCPAVAAVAAGAVVGAAVAAVVDAAVAALVGAAGCAGWDVATGAAVWP